MAKSGAAKAVGLGLLGAGVVGIFAWARRADATTLPGQLIATAIKVTAPVASVVTATIKPPKYGLREVWRGTALPVALSKRSTPAFKVGDQVKIAIKVGPGETVGPEQGQMSTVTSLVARERTVTTAGVTTPTGEPLRWSYVLALAFDGLPLELAEDNLVKG